MEFYICIQMLPSEMWVGLYLTGPRIKATFSAAGALNSGSMLKQIFQCHLLSAHG